jgi:guanosine-diphosphatase
VSTNTDTALFEARPLRSFSMSTALDARRRPSLWSYLSFNSSPRRRSVSLPTRNPFHDPHEKAGRHMGNGSVNAHNFGAANLKDAWMTQSQRSRYLKTGGVAVFLIFLFFLLAPGERTTVRNFVGST